MIKIITPNFEIIKPVVDFIINMEDYFIEDKLVAAAYQELFKDNLGQLLIYSAINFEQHSKYVKDKDCLYYNLIRDPFIIMVLRAKAKFVEVD